MATTPTTSTTFQPAFKRVAQQERHDDTFAAIATLTGKTLEVTGAFPLINPKAWRVTPVAVTVQ